MITTDSINRIRSIAISDIIGKYISLKKHGVNFTGCCPFHNEKTPSFSVNDVKGIYKCFGCGASGDSIQFIIQRDNQTFYEACKTIASLAGIEIEEEKKEYTEVQKATITAAAFQEQVLNYIIPIYRKNLLDLPVDHPAKKWLTERKITDDIIEEWNIGWAGSDWNFISSDLINKNFFEPGNKLGIIKRTQDGERNYDGYRSRITFPITDKAGRFIGLGGRYIQIDNSDASNIPKYINPPDCELYNKSAVLYGLSAAAQTIKEVEHANVVEGYMDVISPHRVGFKNTVATCGTAFTEYQIQLLKRYTKYFVMWRDNDPAGVISFNRSLPDLLKQGIKVDVMKYQEKDPDAWVQTLDTYNKSGGWELPVHVDAVIHRAHEIWKQSEDLRALSEAKRTILELLSNIDNDILRNNYLDQLSKQFNWKGTETRKQLISIMDTVMPLAEDDDTGEMKLPEWVTDEQRDSFEESGYISVNRKNKGKPMVGYYSFTANGKTQITNFLITPLFHVYAGIESRYLLQIYNGIRYGVLDVPAKVIPSVDQFQSLAVSEGNFLIHGAKPQWLRIASDLLQKFPRCIELNNLGWQNFSFFAWVNKIYIPGEGLKDLDNWGILKHNEENFLIPASCEAYRQLQRTGDDPYENDRYLMYKESPVSFSQWCDQMKLVFKQKGIVGIAFTILSIFRDLIFEIDNNCPHLYAFGEPSSGKSKFAESLTAIFFYKKSAFNLNSGTDFAFFNYMQRYNNAPAHLNEFDIEVIRPEWFQAIKGIYDGEGRERGKAGGTKNRTEVMRVRSTLILTGQKLVTADDNSVVTRSLIEPFSTEEYTEADTLNYNQLKEWEGKGMSSMLVELLTHRDLFQKNYKKNYNDQLSQWRKINTDAKQLNQRILQNYAHLASCYQMISKHISLPQSSDDFTDYCFKQAIKWSQFIRSSDTLSEFWRTLEFLSDQQQIFEKWDYIIEEVLLVKVRKNRNEEADHNFDKPTKVLYIRLNNIHKLFQTSFKMRTGKEAMNLDNLLHYFSSRKYFIGPVKSKTWKRIITISENVPRSGLISGNHIDTSKKEQEQKSSCYAFIYEDLGIEIEKFDGNHQTALPFDGQSIFEKNKEASLPFG